MKHKTRPEMDPLKYNHVRTSSMLRYSEVLGYIVRSVLHEGIILGICKAKPETPGFASLLWKPEDK